MRILFVTPYLPHPRSGHGSGDHIFGLVRHFSQTHAVTLLSFADPGEMELADDLRALPIALRLVPRAKGRQVSIAGDIVLAALRICQLVRSIVLWQPYYVSKYYDPAVAKLIREETGKAAYDIVQIEFTFMGQYARCVRSGKTVLRAHDLAFRPSYRKMKNARPGIRKWALFLEWCRWAAYEPKVARRQDHVFTVTEQDRALLNRLSGTADVSYAALGLDVPASVPPYEERERNAILFVGALGHAPNAESALWLCREIFPLVLARRPDAVLRIVGRNAPPELAAAASANRSIELMGFVENLEPVLCSASLAVAPIRSGGGIKTKVVQAMSYGLPVVTTPIGAEGIEELAASGLVIARTAPEIAEGILALLGDRARAAECSRRGRDLAVRHYSWDRTGRRQEQRYESLIMQPTH